MTACKTCSPRSYFQDGRERDVEEGHEEKKLVGGGWGGGVGEWAIAVSQRIYPTLRYVGFQSIHNPYYPRLLF